MVFFGALKWEVLVRRTDRVKPFHATDHWVQPARPIRLVAFWCCGRTAKEMMPGDAYAIAWNPFLEANPTDPTWLQKVRAEDGLDYASGTNESGPSVAASSATLAPWCDACGKWMDAGHCVSTTHKNAL